MSETAPAAGRIHNVVATLFEPDKTAHTGKVVHAMSKSGEDHRTHLDA